ncbi:AcrB/AcrD/AcrF family protein [Synechococcales cyanobacterium C]|uniref:AcrB/AcrD/AcrF family protein n=1 Tax=Petrachloros mirabilis ULC683 TaxID=2781853 RepID=A0A8K2AGR1_9CYAN|nr:efflux RND transporter permease subunit [Petrachloros mirabilis]NCJ04964.1 AcrB/AcrD/AcrF family protein [Petrachloros mirabilis ULC683]
MTGVPTGLKISAIAIRRHIGTLMLTLAVLVMGLFFLSTIQVDLLPSITYPRIGVRLNAPGIAPEILIDEVTRPLEEVLSATEGVVQVYSQTREGRVSVDLYFEPGGNVDQALNEATTAFNRGRGQLPDAIEEPRLFKADPSQLPVYEMALTSPTRNAAELRVLADEDLARELTVIPGVASVDVSGGQEEEIRINIDLARLQALGVGLPDVLNELRDRNQDVSGGRLRGENAERLTRTVGRFDSVREIRNLAFEVRDPQLSTNLNSDNPLTRRVYLRDFAEVVDGTKDQRVAALLNGQSAVKISVQKQPDANSIEVVNRVKDRIEELRSGGILPEDIDTLPTLDESIFIRNSISNVATAGLIGAGLAAISVLLFLGSLRQTLIIVISIPLAILAALIFMRLTGLSLNVFSLGGLALGVGIVVDNSIVMLETIAEGVGMTPGQDATTALTPKQVIEQSIRSSSSVESALVASTSTNLVSVLPFLMIGGFFALLFNELILTISFAVAASILIALTVVPMITSRLLAVPWRSGINRFFLLRGFNRRFEAATAGYRNILLQVLRLRILIILLAFVVLGGSSWWMLGQVPQEILPRINTGQANLFAQFPAGTPLASNQKVMAAVNEILLEQPETEYVFSTVGGFLFGSNTTENPLRSTSNITLKPGSDIEAYVDRVNQEFNRLNLVDIRLRLSPGQVRGLVLSNSPLRNADVDVILQGDDIDTLEAAGREVLSTLDQEATLSSFRPDADSREPELRVIPDWERARALGLSTTDIGNTIQTALEGSVPTQLQRGDRLVDVRVQLDRTAIQQASQLARIPLFGDNRQPIQLADVARIEEGQAPGEIQRINQRAVFLIAGSLTEGANLGAALEEVDEIVSGIELPEGVRLLPSSAAERNREIQTALLVLGSLASFFVFVVMAVQYNSLIDPLVILFTIPLSLSGGVLGLFLTQTAIGATVIIGVVLLVGIVVNNAIIMVDLANQIREQQSCDRIDAILQAAPQRLRPILMTTITTVLGMFPLALGVGEGSEFLQPLGVVVFSGLSLATVLTLFIIPCFYLLLHDGPGWHWRRGIPARTHLRKRVSDHAPTPLTPTKSQPDGLSS